MNNIVYPFAIKTELSMTAVLLVSWSPCFFYTITSQLPVAHTSSFSGTRLSSGKLGHGITSLFFAVSVKHPRCNSALHGPHERCLATAPFAPTITSLNKASGEFEAGEDWQPWNYGDISLAYSDMFKAGTRIFKYTHCTWTENQSPGTQDWNKAMWETRPGKVTFAATSNSDPSRVLIKIVSHSYSGMDQWWYWKR